MLDADIVGELVLEFGDLGAEDVAPVVDDLVDGRLETVTDTFALRAEIDELHVWPQ